MQASDTELVRAINRYHVLDTIRRFAPLSRAEIGERTKLGRSTISIIIAALLEEGVIFYDEADSSVLSLGTRGRPRELLRMNPDFAFAVGAKLSMHQISIAVTNLKGEPLPSLVVPVRTWRLAPETIADLLEDGIRAAIAKAGLEPRQVAGVGIGIPGFIDAVAGISHWSPILGNQPVPFAQMLEKRLDISTVIENDANLVTLAERWFGHGQNVDNFVVVTVEGGIGMGLVLHGDMYSGHHGMGTEFGHSKVDRHGPLCRCGQHGCVEAYAADYAIVREARRWIDLPPTDDEAAMEQAAAEVTAQARAGDERLLGVFREAGEVLGLGIANLVNVLDPGKVIITGAGLRAVDLIEPSLRAAVTANSLKALSGRCEILFHHWADEVHACGAAALVLRGLYRLPWSKGARIEMAL